MRSKRLAFTLVETLIVIGVLIMLAALMLPAVRSAREPARRNACTNNLRQLGLGLDNYEKVHGYYPAAYTVGEEGTPLHSWRSQLLPMLEHQALYERIDFSQAWDSEANASIRKTEVLPLQCPSSPDVDILTNYLGVSGPNSFFHETTKRSADEVVDKLEHTVGVVDAGPDKPVPWMAPTDISEDTAAALGPQTRTNHIHIIQVLFLDGHVKALSIDSDPVIPAALLTISGNDEIDE